MKAKKINKKSVPDEPGEIIPEIEYEDESSIGQTVYEDNAGKRLDIFAGDMLKAAVRGSRSFAKKLIEQEKVTLNGNLGRASEKVKVGDFVKIELPPPEPLDVEPEDLPLDIVYEDSDIAVINKARGMVVHPGAGNQSGTLVNAALFHIRDLSGIGGVARPGIVHRIDKLTSGLLVIAKNDDAHQSLSEQIKEHTARRIYTAIVCGNIKEEEGTVDEPIARHPIDRKRMSVAKEGMRNFPYARNAVTHYKVLERFNRYSLIEARLETGRTHQIRVHMSYKKHPVAGDLVYGSPAPKLGLEGQALHAVALELDHPKAGKHMRFYAPLPDYFVYALNVLGADTDKINAELYKEHAQNCDNTNL